MNKQQFKTKIDLVMVNCLSQSGEISSRTEQAETSSNVYPMQNEMGWADGY
jgi:hypothetical protein